MKNKRHLQIGDQIRDVLARALREELHDPRIGFVTLTSVDVSPDLRHAKVFVSTFQSDETEVLHALEEARHLLQRAIAREARTRFTPRLRFVSDRTSERGFAVEALIDEVAPESSEIETGDDVDGNHAADTDARSPGDDDSA